MQDSDLNRLKDQIRQAKMSNRKKPVYSDSIKSKVADLAQNLSVNEISSMLGVSKSFVGKQKLKIKKVPLQNNSNNAPIQLLQIPARAIIEDPKDNLHRFVKINTPNGISIEVFCTGGLPC